MTTKTDSEIKPCPFCKGSKTCIAYNGQPAKEFFVQCLGCGACGPAQAVTPYTCTSGAGAVPDKIIESWNAAAMETGK